MQPLTIFGLSIEAFLTVAAGVLVALAAVATVLVTRRRDVSANANAVFADALAIQKLVDEAVAKAVKKYADRVDRLEKAMKVERVARRTLRSVFMSYVQRVQNGGSRDLTVGEKEALEAEPDVEDFDVADPELSDA